MRITAVTNGVPREAYKVNGAAYMCFPPSSNLKSTAVEFTDIEDAAIFLIKNKNHGIRMNPGSAIIYNNLIIER